MPAPAPALPFPSCLIFFPTKNAFRFSTGGEAKKSGERESDSESSAEDTPPTTTAAVSPLAPLVKKKRGRKTKAQKEAEAVAAQKEVDEPMHWTDDMVRELLKQRMVVQKSCFSDSRVKQNLTTGWRKITLHMVATFPGCKATDSKVKSKFEALKNNTER
ncbi:hypothetical protein HDU97_000356 [Phlyctochytrium planicorne]|nr:hypothetical protein HDU97_000356 [Phlyctochytrium planicorne]